MSLLGALLLTGLFGCQPPPPPPAPAAIVPPVLSHSEYETMKTTYTNANPQALVGRVEAVLPDSNRLAAGDLPTKVFRTGDVVNILNRDMTVIADGTVVGVDSDFVYIKYAPPVNGQWRVPMVGDIVIRPGQPDRGIYQ
ncbi:MAG TPA: hypothetical protein VMD30_10850 [Tepidisphaeraceae bacterium]|nr:hypothetical protein [Tepidisphaeraceae bacterium]